MLAPFASGGGSSLSLPPPTSQGRRRCFSLGRGIVGRLAIAGKVKFNRLVQHLKESSDDLKPMARPLGLLYARQRRIMQRETRGPRDKDAGRHCRIVEEHRCHLRHGQLADDLIRSWVGIPATMTASGMTMPSNVVMTSVPATIDEPVKRAIAALSSKAFLLPVPCKGTEGVDYLDQLSKPPIIVSPYSRETPPAGKRTHSSSSLAITTPTRPRFSTSSSEAHWRKPTCRKSLRYHITNILAGEVTMAPCPLRLRTPRKSNYRARLPLSTRRLRKNTASSCFFSYVVLAPFRVNEPTTVPKQDLRTG